jgi:hypothetical protein
MRRPTYRQLRTIELGAGVGACGIAMALDGADSVVTDLAPLVPALEVNIQKNGFASDKVQSSSQASRRRRTRKAATRRSGDNELNMLRSGVGVQADCDDDNEQLRTADNPETVQDVIEATKKLSAKEKRAERAARKAGNLGNSVMKNALGQFTDGLGNALKEDALEDVVKMRSKMLSIEDAVQMHGQCRSQAVEWIAEASAPTLQEFSFDVVVLCDGLYENKDCWDALEVVVNGVLALESFGRSAAPELVLASATLRLPFLEEFSSRLIASGFVCAAKEVSDHAVVMSLVRPPQDTAAEELLSPQEEV